MQQSTSYVYKPKPVTTRDDIEKEIEKETSWLMRDGIPHDPAKRKATEIIEKKFAELVEKLKAENKYF